MAATKYQTAWIPPRYWLFKYCSPYVPKHNLCAQIGVAGEGGLRARRARGAIGVVASKYTCPRHPGTLALRCWRLLLGHMHSLVRHMLFMFCRYAGEVGRHAAGRALPTRPKLS
jgi:hypothetical protein